MMYLTVNVMNKVTAYVPIMVSQPFDTCQIKSGVNRVSISCFPSINMMLLLIFCCAKKHKEKHTETSGGRVGGVWKGDLEGTSKTGNSHER